ncbi:NUDIX hydrolase [Stanieria cyanosphaera PCC 7437]|uniref:NUDIX hydrolase n=1 Tax=Stanieria cyanosphaera (strain ATCC 29371 / PCC 7437) TaxID=111780 RepID=K9XUX6_STAC7|nr:NUDIX hydrolase [Stanieria cyanosphaera]AFZ35864.1 NUDIX hydrolase [Stanieria cyanosphaera PCC 7437]
MRRYWRFITTVLGIVFRHPITGVTIIPVLSDGRIVLVKRQDTGQWGLPGGMVDWGEDIPNSVYRELEEETGLNLVKMKRLVGVYSAPDRDPRIHSISILIEAEAKGQLEVRDKLEISEVKAFLPEDLPLGNLSHDHDRQLKDYLNGVTMIA